MGEETVGFDFWEPVLELSLFEIFKLSSKK